MSDKSLLNILPTHKALDIDWLKRWIDPEHLTESALAEFQEAFASHPAKVLQVRNFLKEEVAAGLFQFLSTEAAFETVHVLYSSQGRKVPEADWLQASPQDRVLKYSRLTGARPEVRISPNLMLQMAFRKAVHDPRFCAFFSAISGVPLNAVSSYGGNSINYGDFLRPHSDAVENRHIAFIFYLNPHWIPDFGGALHVWDKDGQESILQAEYNSLVMFDVFGHAQHAVAPIEASAGDQGRLTINGWFYNQE